MENKNTKKTTKWLTTGFTLVEVLVVLAIIGIMTTISLNSLIISNRQQLFLNQFEEIFGMMNSARSLAIAGKGELDYVDYDQDGCNYTGASPCTNGADYVTPANYGVHFEEDGGIQKLKLFADMQLPSSGASGAKLQYDDGGVYTTGDDLVLREVNIDERFEVNILFGDGTLTEVDPPVAIFYSPLYADIKFENVAVDAESPFFIVRLQEIDGVQRCRQIKIHQLAGIPEVEVCN